MAVLRTLLKEISVLADVYARICNYLLADSIKGRICYLSKELAEIVEKGRRLLVQRRQRDIASHGSDGLCAFFSHGKDRSTDILVSIAEGFLKLCKLISRVGLHSLVRDMQIMETYQISVQPLAVGLSECIGGLYLIVLNDASLLSVGKEHFSGAEAVFLNYLVRRYIDTACLRGKNEIPVTCDAVT